AGSRGLMSVMSKTGAEARLKLETWPFQKHGTLSGKVRTVTDDTFTPDPKKDGQHQRPYYKARVEVTATDLRDVQRSFRLIPGMAVTAGIKAGERTILSYFLYPLLRGRQIVKGSYPLAATTSLDRRSGLVDPPPNRRVLRGPRRVVVQAFQDPRCLAERAKSGSMTICSRAP